MPVRSAISFTIPTAAPVSVYPGATEYPTRRQFGGGKARFEDSLLIGSRLDLYKERTIFAIESERFAPWVERVSEATIGVERQRP